MDKNEKREERCEEMALKPVSRLGDISFYLLGHKNCPASERATCMLLR